MKVVCEMKTGVLVLCFVVAASVSSCSAPEHGPYLMPQGRLVEHWAYYPYMEEVAISQAHVGEDIEVRIKVSLPQGIPQELYYSRFGDYPSITQGEGDYSRVVGLFEADHPDFYGGEDWIRLPDSNEIMFRLPAFQTARTYTLGLLAAKSPQHAGLVKTMEIRGGVVGREDSLLYQQWRLGNGKLKWFEYEITVFPAEDSGAEE